MLLLCKTVQMIDLSFQEMHVRWAPMCLGFYKVHDKVGCRLAIVETIANNIKPWISMYLTFEYRASLQPLALQEWPPPRGCPPAAAPTLQSPHDSTLRI